MMEGLCRLCGYKYENKNLISILCSQFNGVLMKIEKILQFTIDPEDTLPKHICETCLHNLDDAYNFITDCHNTQKLLMHSQNINTKLTLKSEETEVCCILNGGLNVPSNEIDPLSNCTVPGYSNVEKNLECSFNSEPEEITSNDTFISIKTENTYDGIEIENTDFCNYNCVVTEQDDFNSSSRCDPISTNPCSENVRPIYLIVSSRTTTASDTKLFQIPRKASKSHTEYMREYRARRKATKMAGGDIMIKELTEWEVERNKRRAEYMRKYRARKRAKMLYEVSKMPKKPRKILSRTNTEYMREYRARKKAAMNAGIDSKMIQSVHIRNVKVLDTRLPQVPKESERSVYENGEPRKEHD